MSVELKGKGSFGYVVFLRFFVFLHSFLLFCSFSEDDDAGYLSDDVGLEEKEDSPRNVLNVKLEDVDGGVVVSSRQQDHPR